MTDSEIHFTAGQFVTAAQALATLRCQLTHFLEVYPMAISPEIQAAFDALNSAVDAETTQISGMLQTLIDRVNAGANTSEIVAALAAAQARVEGISDALPQPPA